MPDCIFCKIANKEVTKEFLRETPEVVIFKDMRPSAPVHYLVVSKKHIPSIKEVEHEEEALIGHMVHTAKEAAEQLNLSGYKLVFNVGRDGGQIVDHIHLHILGGWSR